MNRLVGTPLNIQAIVDSGQAFRWQKISVDPKNTASGDFFYNIVGERVIKIKPRTHQEFEWQTYPKKNDFKFLSWHLNLDKDYPAIIQSINRDQYMHKAIKQYWGLRELRQPLFETLISYIISINKSIKQISRSIEVLAQTWGQPIQADGSTFYSFPEAKTLDLVSEKELAQVTRVGFRAKYIKKVVREITTGQFDLAELEKCQGEAGAKLQQLYGVGPKVADCVALFALGHDHVIPFDVWMKRIFTQVYQQPEKAKYSHLQEFANQYFGPYAGWAHQFLFMYSREQGIEKLKSAQV